MGWRLPLHLRRSRALPALRGPILTSSRFGDRGDDANVMARLITPRQLNDRLDTHLTSHYMQLHATLVSITLAAAGFAAASLATSPKRAPDSGALLWLLWAGGLLAISVVYAGTMTGVFALPAGIPSLWDLLIPLVIG